MDMFSILIWLISLIWLSYSFYKDKSKGKEILNNALKQLLKMLPTLLVIILVMGVVLVIIDKDTIMAIMKNTNPVILLLSITIVGSIAAIPSIVAFPLIAYLISLKVPVLYAVTLLTTLSMVSFVTLPLEIKTFGRKFAIYRNVFSLIGALIIAVAMEVML